MAIAIKSSAIMPEQQLYKNSHKSSKLTVT
jgi:hypothetical protein